MDDVHGVRIIPSVLEFKNVEQGNRYKIHLTVKNVSKTSREIRYWPPARKNFSLLVTNPDKAVAAGLEVPAVLECTVTDETEYTDRVVVTVDGKVIEVPIKVTPPQPDLVLESPVDFGKIVAKSRVVSRELKLTNYGAKEGEFQIKYSGNKPITLTPSTGTVPAMTSLFVKVECVTKQPGKFEEEAKVILEGKGTKLVKIVGNVVKGGLELLSAKSEDRQKCVDFGSVYFGTDNTESAFLYNNSPEPVCFIAVLNQGTPGEEMSNDLSGVGKEDPLSGGVMNDLSSILAVFPNQGKLAPFEKIPMYFRFSPRWLTARKGFNCSQTPPPRRDFALFVTLQPVGSNAGSWSDSNKESESAAASSCEVAVTATAMPVLLNIVPKTHIAFGTCDLGAKVDKQLTLTNQSTSMSVSYRFRRIAQFATKPLSGRIKPQQIQEAIVSFVPKQIGSFDTTLYVDVMGPVADPNNPFAMRMDVIYSFVIPVSGCSDSITTTADPVYNNGITPMISNEVGLCVDTPANRAQLAPRGAIHRGMKSQLHRSKSCGNSLDTSGMLVALPNDRAQSIRPADKTKTVRTVFTGAERYTYTDPDYMYTEEELAMVNNNKDQYATYIRELRDRREEKRRNGEFFQYNNEKDIDIKPASGLKATRLLVADVGRESLAPSLPNANFGMLNSSQMKNSAAFSKAVDGLNAIPLSRQEKADCTKMLLPAQLHQIMIGPPTVDFGQVCLKSQSKQDLSIVNSLDQYIHVVLQVDCAELRQTSPLSQVIPPQSRTVIPLVFESHSKGRFQRSLEYTINGNYKSHVTIFADVVSAKLEMSTNELILGTQPGLPADTAIRGVVTLFNRLNHPAEFVWNPIVDERGTAFSMRPAAGTVGPFTDLDCEVVFHPSYHATEEGLFELIVKDGTTEQLKCRSELGASNVQFIDRRVNFGLAPLNLITKKTASLKNIGTSHAFFQVQDPQPFPGLTIAPVCGVVPVGGMAELTLELLPNALIKFDTRVNIIIRGGKTLELRIAGAVEPPCVDIDLQNFNIGGVYCGSVSYTPFKLENKGCARARVEFDMSRFPDFSVRFASRVAAAAISGNANGNGQSDNPNAYSITLEPEEIAESELVFRPTQVASYDFIIPVTINKWQAPTPSPTPAPPTPSATRVNTVPHIINPRPVDMAIVTPRRKIIATALRQPISITNPRLEFILWPDLIDITSGSGECQITRLVNQSERKVKWSIDKVAEALDKGFRLFGPTGQPIFASDNNKNGNSSDNVMTNGTKAPLEGILQPKESVQLSVIFCSEKPGHVELSLPIILFDNHEIPYQYLTLVGETKLPQIWFKPNILRLMPVPLDMETSADFCLYAANYTKKNTISVETPIVELEDGSKISPLKVTFLDGQDLLPCRRDDFTDAPPTSLRCRVTFKSAFPIAFSQPITFTDKTGGKFSLLVQATCENCLLTCYPFIAQQRENYRIVCTKGSLLKGTRSASKEGDRVGEAVLIRNESANGASLSSRPSTTSFSTFDKSTSSYEDDGQLSSSSGFSTPHGPRQAGGAPSYKAPNGPGAFEGHGSKPMIASFMADSAEERYFIAKVVNTVQRWFSAQGWPGGANPISIPSSLRSGLTRKPTDEKVKSSVRGEAFDSNNSKKEFRTIYDMIGYLAGKPIPGIPINNPLPTDPKERVKQVYWQHSTLLTFLKTQGAYLINIKPQYLMTPADYRTWVALQSEIADKTKSKSENEVNDSKSFDADMEILDEDEFEIVSWRVWTDVLLQILKTLVLARVNVRQFNALPSPRQTGKLPNIDPNPLCSNIYSVSERIILLWLNNHYEQQRDVIWGPSSKGGVPPPRWIVNFDLDLLDGLVIAAALGAYQPYLIKSHLADMYTLPTTPEQCLHNALKIVGAIQSLGSEYDIQATDITDPNPLQMMLLCIYLYGQLPHYLPVKTIDFVGDLQNVVTRHVTLTNPSAKPVAYEALIMGPDAGDFALANGNAITVGPKSTVKVPIQFKSRFMREAEASVAFIGRCYGAQKGNTSVFGLKGVVEKFSAKSVVLGEGPCYTATKIAIKAKNPYPSSAEFRIEVLQTGTEKQVSGAPNVNGVDAKKKSIKNFASRTGLTNDAASKQPKAVKSQDAPLKAFFVDKKTVSIDPNGTANTEIVFLPFNIGKHRCSVVFVNDTLGQFVVNVEATATLPHPISAPFVTKPRSVRISSAAAAGRGRGVYGGEVHTIYWRCDVGQPITETICLPLINNKREEALLGAMQQLLTPEELARRKLTGTLKTTALGPKLLQWLQLPGKDVPVQDFMAITDKTFTVELDSPLFSAPSTLHIPAPADDIPGHAGSPPPYIELPLTFEASTSGHYPCNVILRAPYDIRVYHIECTACPSGSDALIEFTSPVHVPVLQEIPIINETEFEWPLQATIQGKGFTGPPTLLAAANKTTQYPLQFRPHHEGRVEGMLTLTNTQDGMEHTFMLVGNGDCALSSGTISITCEAKEKIEQMLTVPNGSKRKVYFKVESDLPFLSGPESVVILPGQAIAYPLTVVPLRRGTFKGTLSFTATSNPDRDVDSDGDELPDPDRDELTNRFRVWFNVEVSVSPCPPEKVLDIVCPCQKQIVVDVGMNNPSNTEINLEVKVKGTAVSGPSQLTIAPHSRGSYELTFAPAVVGQHKGSIVCFHELTGEFWYELNLIAEKPEVIALQSVECDVGQNEVFNIRLTNPLAEPLRLVSSSTNEANYCVLLPEPKELILPPKATNDVPVRFTPSSLGKNGHQASIIFKCKQLGQWTFDVSGNGLLPQPLPPVTMSTTVGERVTVCIPFINPMDVPVIADIRLIDKDEQMSIIADPAYKSPFELLVRQTEGVRVGPRAPLDLVVSFTPERLSKAEGVCSVIIRREDGGSWHYTPSRLTEGSEVLRSASGGIREVRWLYPIYGYPELLTTTDVPPTVIECSACSRREERVEVVLPFSATTHSVEVKDTMASELGVKTRPLTSTISLRDSTSHDRIVIQDDYRHELLYPDDTGKDDLDHSLVLSLVRKELDNRTKLVTLTFNMVYAPHRSMRHNVTLVVRNADGAIWRFPLCFSALEATPDDVICVEAAGLNRESSVTFRLTSQDKQPVAFTAQFQAGSDPDLVVSPQAGELLPEAAGGTTLKVTFTPTKYGRVAQGRLVIQTSDAQWTYAVQGTVPGYAPPRGRSSQLSLMGGSIERGRPVNYLTQNRLLLQTANSSPVKGAPLNVRRLKPIKGY